MLYYTYNITLFSLRRYVPMDYIPIVVSVCSLLLALYTYMSKANKESTTELTTVIVKLEAISGGISDIKSEIASLKDDQRTDHDKIIKLESSLATAWKRIDELRGDTSHD